MTMEGAMVGIDLGAVPGQVLEVYRGDTVRVTGTYFYQGPKVDGLKFKAAIGHREPLIGFIETLKKEKSFTQYAPGGEDFDISVDIPITTDIGHGVYDIYCKLSIPGAKDLISADVTDCIKVIVAAEFRDLRVVSFEKI